MESVGLPPGHRPCSDLGEAGSVAGGREPTRVARTAGLPALGAALILCLTHDARADSDGDDEVRAHAPRRTAEVLLDMDDAVRTERAEGASFGIRKRYGFEYAQKISSGSGPPVIFS